MVKTRYLLFWFDVEDCTMPRSDEAAKRLANILTKYGVRGTMKVVGQKARMFRERLRYDVIDALSVHAIGFHSDMHGFRPQPAEYMSKFDWLEGSREFERREFRGLEAVRLCWDKDIVCYGQPGSNWSPQVYPVLRKWSIPAYVSNYGYIGLHAQPFRYGDIINSSHLYGKDVQGREVSHSIGLNFELGAPGALEEHLKQFDQSYSALENGGVISIMNHPCTLIKEEWFTDKQKSEELIEAGYEHFETFLKTVLNYPNVKTITADQLPVIYEDYAKDYIFSHDELLSLAKESTEEINFHKDEKMSVSPAEMFGMFVRFIHFYIKWERLAPGAVCRHLDGPAASAESDTDVTASGSDFSDSINKVYAFIEQNNRLPDVIAVGNKRVSPDDYFTCMARTVIELIKTSELPHTVRFSPGINKVRSYVDEDLAVKGWSGTMMLPGFTAPKLLEQAYLQTWTLKPGILVNDID
jgi:hypothetical protein